MINYGDHVQVVRGIQLWKRGEKVVWKSAWRWKRGWCYAGSSSISWLQPTMEAHGTWYGFIAYIWLFGLAMYWSLSSGTAAALWLILHILVRVYLAYVGCKDLVCMLLRCCLFAGLFTQQNPKNKVCALSPGPVFCIIHYPCLDMHDLEYKLVDWCLMFPGSVCVSGFATPVVNCGTACVPMGFANDGHHSRHGRCYASFHAMLPAMFRSGKSHVCVCGSTLLVLHLLLLRKHVIIEPVAYGIVVTVRFSKTSEYNIGP